MTSGQPRSVDAPLVDVPQTGSLTADWRLSAFEAYLPDIHPAATGFTHQLLVDANPYTLSGMPRIPGGTPDMLWLELPPGVGDQALDAVAYGEFLPSWWVEFTKISFIGRVAITAPGASSSSALGGSIGRYDPMPLAAGPVEPVVTPPRAPRVGSADGFGAPVGVGTSPVLSWSPPSVGTATGYAVQLLQPVVSPGGGTGFQTIGYLSTTGTSMRIPPGVLQPGVEYVGFITAWARDQETIETAPFRVSYPEGWASAIVIFTT
jgi:hypothetical protein